MHRVLAVFQRAGDARDSPGAPRETRRRSASTIITISSCSVVCADQPIMTKWKWMLAARVPAKLFIVNENGDHFWFDYSQWRIIKHFILYRAGLSGADAVRTIARLLTVPFTVLFLLAYTAIVHARRALRRVV